MSALIFMGEYADMFRDEELDDIQSDGWYFHVRRGKKPGVCRRCGKQTLHWEFQDHRWRLFNVDNTPHKCDELKLAQEAFTKL